MFRSKPSGQPPITFSNCSISSTPIIDSEQVAALRAAASAAEANARAIQAIADALRGPNNSYGVHIGGFN